MTDARWHPTWLVKASIGVHLAAVIFLIVQPASWRTALLVVLANHAMLALLGLWPRSRLFGPNLTHLPGDARVRKEIALTFDDGPDPIVTPKILDILDRYACTATFFCIGEKAALYPELCRQIAKRGHAVENHTQRHSLHFAFMGLAGLKRDLQAAQDTLQGLTGQRPRFFRAPAGLRSPLLDPVLTHLGLELASWSVRGFDTQSGNVERVNRRLQKGLKAGAILLLHDGNAALTSEGNPVVLDVLPTVLNAARTIGLQCVTLRHARSLRGAN